MLFLWVLLRNLWAAAMLNVFQIYSSIWYIERVWRKRLKAKPLQRNNTKTSMAQTQSNFQYMATHRERAGSLLLWTFLQQRRSHHKKVDGRSCVTHYQLSGVKQWLKAERKLRSHPKSQNQSQTEQQADKSRTQSQAADGQVRAYREEPRVQGLVMVIELEGSMKILTLETRKRFRNDQQNTTLYNYFSVNNAPTLYYVTIGNVKVNL